MLFLCGPSPPDGLPRAHYEPARGGGSAASFGSGEVEAPRDFRGRGRQPQAGGARDPFPET